MADLREYDQKRDFSKTSEPEGKAVKKASKRLKFVVQHHIASHDHYDFRLEWDGVLKSWAVPKGPSYNSHDKRLAVQVEDHPLEYGGFEGTIPKGEYGGGTVMLWDEGEWEPLVDPEKGLEEGSLKLDLKGHRLKGKWALVRMKPRPKDTKPNWLLIKERDEYEEEAYDIKQFVTSVETGRTMDQIGAGEAVKKELLKATGKKPVARHKLSDFRLTNPDKVLFEEGGITKGEVAAYYLKVAKRMLPYVEGRLISAVRCPRGIDSACFFKKHPANDSKGIGILPVPGSDGKKEDYFYIQDVYGLMTEVQLNTLEFHTWGSRVETLELPDVMVFDLDPDEGLEPEKVRQGVKDLKAVLDELGLTSYLKTSGGKGYHVVIPLRPVAGWDSFHDFARNIAGAMELKWPDRYTSNVRKAQRKGRIFIDWIRNGRGATSVAPYSVRAREGAPVSMPIAWRELDKVAPAEITMEEAVKRLRRKDPWEGFFEVEQKLK